MDMRIVTLKIAVDVDEVDQVIEELGTAASSLPGIVLGLGDDKLSVEEDELAAKLGRD